MDALLCTMSPKRLALVEEDSAVLGELIEARTDEDTEVPGLLDLDKTWHALDLLLGADAAGPLGDAIVARSGRKLKVPSAYGQARLLAPARVAEIARALAALPTSLVADRYDTLHGKPVHGELGQAAPGSDDKTAELEDLADALAEVVDLYAEAAAAGHSMMSVLI